MATFACFASTYDEIEDVKRDLMLNPLDFKKTMQLVLSGTTVKDAMQKFVFTNDSNQFMDKHKRAHLYFLNENGEISTFQEMIDI